MPYTFHENRKLYFEHQTLTTENYILPFIEETFLLKTGMAVLEIGCGEAGVLKAFLKRGCRAVGVELSADKLTMAKEMMKHELQEKRLSLINKNIYDESFKKEFKARFDLIILKDVIEHINEQEKLISYLHTFLKPGGAVFFSFPPWQMPFGGHQQMCNSKLSKVPFIHLLPKPLYKRLLKLFNEPQGKISSLVEMKSTLMTIEKFKRILTKHNYSIINKQYFLINPIYKYKFKLKPQTQFSLIAALPYLRNFLTTAVYYLVKGQDQQNE